MVEPSHELLVYVVEAERVPRAALAAGLEADGVLDIPVLFRVVLRDLVPAWARHGQAHGEDGVCTRRRRDLAAIVRQQRRRRDLGQKTTHD